MKLLRNIAILILFSLLCLIANGQVCSIKGTVKDEKGCFIANVFILLSDTTKNNPNKAEFVDILETDSLGRFTLSKDVVFNKIIANRMGYIPVELGVNSVSDSIDIIMKSDGSTILEEMVVKGYKQAVKMNVTGLVYDMKYSPVKQGTPIDALRFIPLVHMEGNVVKIIGKSGVKYYLNGKELKLKGQALEAYLQTLSIKDIETIEVITSYDPRYNLGLENGGIHIVTKRKENEGWKGNVQGNIWKTHHIKGTGSLLLSYNKEKLSSDFFFSGSSTNTWEDNISITQYKMQNRQTETGNIIDGKNKFFNVQGLFNYSYAKNKTLNGYLNIGHTNENRTDVGFTKYKQGGSGDVYAEISHNNSLSSDGITIDGNLTYQLITDRNGKLKISLNYYHGNQKTSRFSYMDSVIIGMADQPHKHYKEIIPQTSNVWSVKGVYTHPLNKKTILSLDYYANYWKLNENDSYYTGSINGWLKDKKYSFHQKTDEWNLFGIISIINNWNKKMTSGFGAGIERREYKSKEINGLDSHQKHLWQPYALVVLNALPNTKLSLKYNADYRLSNPAFSNMIPYRRYVSASTYRTGNPKLSQVKRFKQNLTAQLFQNYILFFSHRYVDDAIVLYNQVTEDGMIEIRPENMDSYHDFTINFNASNLNYLKDKGSLRITVGASRKWYHTRTPKGETSNRVSDSWFLQMNNAVTLFPVWQVQMVNSLNYSSKQKRNFEESPARIYFYTSFQKDFGNWRFNLNVSVNSFVYGNLLKFCQDEVYETSELHTFTSSKGEPISCGFNLSYTFGNNRVKAVKRIGSSIDGLKERLSNE